VGLDVAHPEQLAAFWFTVSEAQLIEWALNAARGVDRVWQSRCPGATVAA
jgi:hypothetical protein